MVCKFRFGTATLFPVLAALCCTGFGSGDTSRDFGSWPQWRGPGRDARSAETGLLDDWRDRKPELVWNADGMGNGFAGVSVADGRVFTTGNFDDAQAVVAVSAADGSRLWKTPVTDSVPRHGYRGSRCTPTVDGDRLYVVPSSGAIVCLRASDGEILWRKEFRKEWNGRMMSGWGFAESPLVDGEKVVCTPGGRNAMLVALDKFTGEEIWRSAVPDDLGSRGKDGAAYSSIVISEGAGVKQYVQLTGRGVIGVRARDGKFLWNYNRVANGTANIPTPVVSDDYVFCSSGYGTGAALLRLSPDGGGVRAEEVYFLESQTLQNHHGGMVLVDGYIYCGHGHNKGFPRCIELDTGEVAWGKRIRGPGRGSAAVVYADGNLIYRYQSGEVGLIEATPDEYRLKGSFAPEVVDPPSWAHPVVCGGRLYLRERDHLMVYDLSNSSRQ